MHVYNNNIVEYKARESHPMALAYPERNMPFGTLKLPGAGPIYEQFPDHPNP